MAIGGGRCRYEDLWKGIVKIRCTELILRRQLTPTSMDVSLIVDVGDGDGELSGKRSGHLELEQAGI